MNHSMNNPMNNPMNNTPMNNRQLERSNIQRGAQTAADLDLHSMNLQNRGWTYTQGPATGSSSAFADQHFRDQMMVQRMSLTKSNFDQSKTRDLRPSLSQLKTFPKSLVYDGIYQERLRFHKRDMRRIMQRYPDGPPQSVKITMTKAGRFFLHAPLYVQKKEVSPQAQGHSVALDPGSNPYVTYYSPIAMVVGSFGTNVDLRKTFRPYQDQLDRITSFLGDKGDDGLYLPPNTGRRLNLRRF
ncbi:hypothetical protein DFS34DRAFT_591932 [Phlyctochytrium arcticum]|nr:hypothetical protein DFS34DRAFT_591932 [Phlyctochytrium arcticum]